MNHKAQNDEFIGQLLRGEASDIDVDKWRSRIQERINYDAARKKGPRRKGQRVRTDRQIKNDWKLRKPCPMGLQWIKSQLIISPRAGYVVGQTTVQRFWDEHAYLARETREDRNARLKVWILTGINLVR